MKWITPLYVGKHAAYQKEDMIRGINSGKYRLNAYVIVLPFAKGNQLEIIHCVELKQPYYKKHEPVIVGIAYGKGEAFEVVSEIATEAMAALGSPDILGFLKQRQRAKAGEAGEAEVADADEAAEAAGAEATGKFEAEVSGDA